MTQPQSDNLIVLLGLEDLPLENRAQLVSELEQILEVRVLQAAYQTLSEDQAEELDTYVELNQPEKVGEFVQQNVPQLNEIFASELEKLKLELVDYRAELVKNMESKE